MEIQKKQKNTVKNKKYHKNRKIFKKNRKNWGEMEKS